ncbi:MAG: glycosyltransferase [Bacteroidota bacterium]
MKFLIVTHVLHSIEQKQYYAYAPYVREMNLWLKYVDKCIVVAPIIGEIPTAIDITYEHSNIVFYKIPSVALTSLINILKTIIAFPFLILTIAKAMKQADHIHLRCPGNIGLIACVVQIFFPNKIKTAKYAGNWDTKSKQPWSYRLQKWILSNTFLTRNMLVLVYGEWEGQSKNIKPFFTATYKEEEKEIIQKTITPATTIKLIFVGSLVSGKNPMYAIQLLEQLRLTNKNVFLDIYGEGTLREELEKYIVANNLSQYVALHGNQNTEVLKKAYQESHFVILASKSEGWPKAVAEGMFWGAVPLATSVSCVPYMLDQGNRGILLQMDLNRDVVAINELIDNSADFENKSKAATNWSRSYTLDRFENEIQKLLQ